MAALRSQQADGFLEFLQASCTSCKQELSRSVALHCQVLWVTQTPINKIILPEAEKAGLKLPRNLKDIGKPLLRKSNNRHFFFVSIFIEFFYFELDNREKASETASSVTRSLDIDHFLTVRTQPWAFGVLIWYKQLYFSQIFF